MRVRVEVDERAFEELLSEVGQSNLLLDARSTRGWVVFDLPSEKVAELRDRGYQVTADSQQDLEVG